MLMKKLNNTGVTLLEILLASVIFVLSVAGIFATLSFVRASVTNKESSLTAALFGKQVLEKLRSAVNMGGANPYYNACTGNANPCPDFSLSLLPAGVHRVPSANMPAGLIWPTALKTANTFCDANGCLEYTVSCGDNCSNIDAARKVDLIIHY
jgi:Tfp pilus assembly protein PilV